MKKTMITLAAAMFAATVTMAAVTSQVVGYSTVDLAQGFTVLTPTFEAIATGNLSYKDIKLVGGADFDQFQVFDSTGAVIQSVYYWADDQSWYEQGTDAEMNNVEIPLGTAYFFLSQNGGQMIVAGKVLTDSVMVSLEQGFTPFGNPYAVPVTYGSLTVGNLVDFDQFQIFDSTGAVVQSVYFWADDQSWYEQGTDAEMNTVEIPAGQGFFFLSQNAGGTITFPSLTL